MHTVNFECIHGSPALVDFPPSLVSSFRYKYDVHKHREIATSFCNFVDVVSVLYHSGMFKRMTYSSMFIIAWLTDIQRNYSLVTTLVIVVKIL